METTGMPFTHHPNPPAEFFDVQYWQDGFLMQIFCIKSSATDILLLNFNCFDTFQNMLTMHQADLS